MKQKNYSLEILGCIIVALIALGLTYDASIVIVDPVSTRLERLLAVPMVISLYVIAPPVHEHFSYELIGWAGSFLIYGTVGISLWLTVLHFIKKLVGRGGSGGTRI